jgi:hypothetical protein
MLLFREVDFDSHAGRERFALFAVRGIFAVSLAFGLGAATARAFERLFLDRKSLGLGECLAFLGVGGVLAVGAAFLFGRTSAGTFEWFFVDVNSFDLGGGCRCNVRRRGGRRRGRDLRRGRSWSAGGSCGWSERGGVGRGRGRWCDLLLSFDWG